MSILASAELRSPGSQTTPPTFTAAMSGARLVITFSLAVINSTDLTTAGSYTITPPGGSPAVTVTDVAVTDSTHLSLGLSGDTRGGGSYSVSLLANTARSEADGSGNAAASASFSISATTLKVVSATPLTTTTLRVVFSKAVKQVSSSNTNDALHAANYVISSAAGSLAVSSVATVGTAGDTVDLTTAQEGAGVIYSLVVSNVQDLAGNTI